MSHVDDDLVFRALADPTRRALLDELFRHDGQNLGALEARFAMTRFGIGKHLRLLEEAGLVVSRRKGREKVHFLNPVPIRLVHDRWVDKFTRPWVAGLSDLKHALEASTAQEAGMDKVFEVYIRTTPRRLWEALTGDERARYQFGMHVASDWTVGSRVVFTHPGSPGPLGDGEILELDPPTRMVMTMRALWSEDVEAEGTSRVTYEIDEFSPGHCSLVVTHDQLREGANEQLYGGWPMILSGLKTWLETGEELVTPGSLMYAGLTAQRDGAQPDAPQPVS